MPHLLDVTMLWGQNSGGVRRYLGAKQDWLHAHTSWRHTIAAPGAQGNGHLSIRAWPLPFSGGYRLPLNRRGNARVLVAQKPDLIEVGDPFRLAWSALDAARQLAIPLTGFCHSNLVAMARRVSGNRGACLAQRYVTRLFEQFDMVLTPSQNMRDTLLQWGLRHVVHQPLGVDTDSFSPAWRDLSWRSALGLAPRARMLLYTGRFGAEKNLQVLADAVSLLGEPYVLIAIGAGPCPPRGSRVLMQSFTNNRETLARALASADVFVHAGDQETFGLSVLEALACGCPVVACGQAGLGELVNERVGVRVDKLRALDFAQAIEWVFSRDPTSYAHAARNHALHYRWQSAMDRLFMRYQQLLNVP